MTIKDVEKLTGLTAKSIRYYEEKGLLTVERNEENDYRSYSETEVNRLKKIKLLRYLEFSVEEVKSMLDMDAKEIEKVLYQKAEEFSDQRDRCKDKQEFCISLANDYKKSEDVLNQIVSEYNEAIENIESEEMAEIVEDLKELGTPSLSYVLLYTLMFLGPILWLFINISEGNYEDLMINAALAIGSTVFMTGIWIFYFTQRRKSKNRVKYKNKADLWIFPVLIIAFVGGIAVAMGFHRLVEMFLAPEGYLFYEIAQPAKKALIWFIMIPIILICLLLIAKISKKDEKQMEKMSDLLMIWNRLGKWKWFVIVVWLIGLYCCLTSVTVVTEDSIICHSPIRPTGVKYSYSDVEQITTGFGQETFTFEDHKRKGEFYYQIELEGKTITFCTGTSTNQEIERYDQDTYLWYEEFDQRLVDLGIPKLGDTSGYENCDIAEYYLDRFIRIIENK